MQLSPALDVSRVEGFAPAVRGRPVFGRRAIETRLIVAYALIVLMVAAVIAIGYLLHYNSHRQRSLRQRRRERARRAQSGQ